MKKKIISAVLACITLMVCVVSVYAYSASDAIGPSGSQTSVSITWAAETVTAHNALNYSQSDSYCKSYINYDNGEYLSAWNTSIKTAISATTTHSVYPPGATRISTYETYHRVTIGGTNYTKSFVK